MNLRIPRCHANLITVNGSMYICGGATRTHTYNESILTSECSVDKYDAERGTWFHVTDMVIGRHSAGATVIGMSYENYLKCWKNESALKWVIGLDLLNCYAKISWRYDQPAVIEKMMMVIAMFGNVQTEIVTSALNYGVQDMTLLDGCTSCKVAFSVLFVNVKPEARHIFGQHLKLRPYSQIILKLIPTIFNVSSS